MCKLNDTYIFIILSSFSLLYFEPMNAINFTPHSIILAMRLIIYSTHSQNYFYSSLSLVYLVLEFVVIYLVMMYFSLLLLIQLINQITYRNQNYMIISIDFVFLMMILLMEIELDLYVLISYFISLMLYLLKNHLNSIYSFLYFFND